MNMKNVMRVVLIACLFSVGEQVLGMWTPAERALVRKALVPLSVSAVVTSYCSLRQYDPKASPATRKRYGSLVFMAQALTVVMPTYHLLTMSPRVLLSGMPLLGSLIGQKAGEALARLRWAYSKEMSVSRS